MASGAQKLPSLGLRGLTPATGVATAAMPVTGGTGVMSAGAAAGGASGVCIAVPFARSLGGVGGTAGAGRPSSTGPAACVRTIRHCHSFRMAPLFRQRCLYDSCCSRSQQLRLPVAIAGEMKGDMAEAKDNFKLGTWHHLMALRHRAPGKGPISNFSNSGQRVNALLSTSGSGDDLNLLG